MNDNQRIELLNFSDADSSNSNKSRQALHFDEFDSITFGAIPKTSSNSPTSSFVSYDELTIQEKSGDTNIFEEVYTEDNGTIDSEAKMKRKMNQTICSKILYWSFVVIIAIGCLLSIISLFFPWYKITTSGANKNNPKEKGNIYASWIYLYCSYCDKADQFSFFPLFNVNNAMYNIPFLGSWVFVLLGCFVAFLSLVKLITAGSNNMIKKQLNIIFKTTSTLALLITAMALVLFGCGFFLLLPLFLQDNYGKDDAKLTSGWFIAISASACFAAYPIITSYLSALTDVFDDDDDSDALYNSYDPISLIEYTDDNNSNANSNNKQRKTKNERHNNTMLDVSQDHLFASDLIEKE